MDTKAWILEAAIQLFSKNGYTNTTTKAISDLAGVSESTFFRNYKNKRALFKDLLYYLTPGPENISFNELTNGTDLKKDFEIFLYSNAILHIKHVPVWRLAMHIENIYDSSRFSRIEGLITQMSGYLDHLKEAGLVIDFDYRALAEHVNALVLIKANEFLAGEQYGRSAEKSAEAFAKQYAEFFTELLGTKQKKS